MAEKKRKISKNRKFRRSVIAGAGAACLILCLILVIFMTGHTVRLSSNSRGVEFITRGETVTGVNIRGQLPFLSIVPGYTESRVKDAQGNITEEIRVYIIEAEFSLSRQMSMHLNIEAPDDMLCTYILKFADRDVRITNGRVVK